MKKLIIDGAIGTLLMRKQLSAEAFRGERFINHPQPLVGNYDILNLTQPEIVRHIHQDYINAGADIIKTNSFNANKISQQEYGLQDYVYDINFSSVTLVKEAIQQVSPNPKKKVFIAGSIGSTPYDFSKINSSNRQEILNELIEAYQPQIKGLLDAGVDYLLIETVVHSCSAEAALVTIKNALQKINKNIPVIVSICANNKNELLYSGESLNSFAKNLQRFQLFAVGFNCVDLDFGYIPLYNILAEIPSLHRCFMPGISSAVAADEVKINPEMFAEKLLIFAERAGVDLVGGCCGTTPAFIESIINLSKKDSI